MAFPERVGFYRIVGELGRGGMGVVYRAEDERTGRTVALKLLPPHLSEDRSARDRLVREAHAASSIEHENVCAFYEAGEADDGRLFLVLALYEGETLLTRLARGPLPLGEAIEIAFQVARGLSAAHSRGIVHRDLKPSNVFLCRDGTVKILDFGIARVTGGATTRPGSTAYTLEYVAPEQLHGQATPQTDLWALGVLLYEMLGGRRPFGGRYEAALLYAILHTQPASLRKTRAEVPETVEEVVFRCLEKRPEDRFADAAGLEQALEAALAGEHPASSRRIRRRFILSGAAILVASLVGFFAWPSLREALLPLPVQRQIAVLPFAASGTGGEEQAFADGLVLTLANELTQFERAEKELWVIPWSEVQKRGITTAGDAWRALRATLVVTGTIHRTTDRIRIPLQLIDARTGRQLRSATVDVRTDELSSIPLRASFALGAMLDEVLTGGSTSPPAPPTSVPSAYEAFLLARGYLGGDRTSVEQLAAARKLFAQAVHDDPDFALALAHLAQTSLDLARVKAEPHWAEPADSLIERAVALSPGSAVIQSIYADFLVRRGRHDDAIRAVERAIAIDPTYLDAYNALARLLLPQNGVTAAEAVYRTAIQKRPSDWRPRYELGILLNGKTTRYAEARTTLLEALRLAPENEAIYFHLASIARRLGEDPRPYVERAIAIRPSAFAYTYMGVLSTTAGAPEEALRYHELAVSMDSLSGDIWAELAWAQWRIPARRAHAATAFQACARHFASRREIDPHDVHVTVRLAQCAAGSGDVARARAELARIRPVDQVPDRAWAPEKAAAYLLVGDTLEAVEHLHASLAADSSFREVAMRYVEFRPLLSHPRMIELEQSAARRP